MGQGVPLEAQEELVREVRGALIGGGEALRELAEDVIGPLARLARLPHALDGVVEVLPRPGAIRLRLRDARLGQQEVQRAFLAGAPLPARTPVRVETGQGEALRHLDGAVRTVVMSLLSEAFFLLTTPHQICFSRVYSVPTARLS